MSGANADVGPSSYLDLAFDRLLDAFADARPAPAGGSAAAGAVALAASVATMAARLSTGHHPDAEEVALELDAVRHGVGPLIDEDARVFTRVLAARRLGDAGQEVQRGEVAAALSDAADVPAQVVLAGARVAHLAAEIAVAGNPEVRGDAIVAAQLAAAGSAAAAALVRINLVGDPDDHRRSHATKLAGQASAAADRALRAIADPPGEDPTAPT